ncbi:MAG: serine/threonine protein kinase [Blastocatellia bacterium]|nr:serine/threonine protein kinase [Blastocatellia bacterium]
MNQHDWKEIESIFHKLLETPPQERSELLSKLSLDRTVRNEIESLLKSDQEAGSFLDSPVKLLEPRPEEDIALEGEVLDSKYSIETRLGQGGMGYVYLALHLGTRRKVAIKIISPKFMTNLEFVKRFQQEAQAAGALRHPNIVNVTDFGFTQLKNREVAYLVMEYLNGLSLGTFIKRHQKLPLDLVIDITEQICLAVAEAHSKAIIHRDLKPENIWLESNRREGFNVKVLDFGLAKIYDPEKKLLNEDIENSTENDYVEIEDDSSSEEFSQQQTLKLSKDSEANNSLQLLTRAGMIVGTPLYMSPEQCAGQSVSPQSDIYSIGIIVYQMLTGETPFSGSTHSLLQKHIQELPTDISEKSPNIPKPISQLIMSTLAKKPEARPSNALSFALGMKINFEGFPALLKQAQNFSTALRPALVYTSLKFHVPLLLIFLSLPLIHPAIFPISFLGIFFSNAFISALYSVLVNRLIKTTEVKVEPLTFQDLKTYIRPTIFTTLLAIKDSLIKQLTFKRSLARSCSVFTLLPEVIISEKLSKDAALRRAEELVKNFYLISQQINIQNLWLSIFGFLIYLYLIQTLFWGRYSSFYLSTFLEKAQKYGFVSVLYSLVFITPTLFFLFNFNMFIAVGLFYRKAFQANSHSMEQALDNAVLLSTKTDYRVTLWTQTSKLLLKSVIFTAIATLLLALAISLLGLMGLSTGDFRFIKYK